MESFITIKENVSEEITEKKSKFIANLVKVRNKQEAEDVISKIKKNCHDARHNCVAYRVIEDDMIIEKSSDDGEPSGTAGGPMLNILQKNNLCNVLVIVTRYFGGILLGTGGLVRAYSEATTRAIENSERVEMVYGVQMQAKIEYSEYEKFKYYCQKNNIKIESSEYGQDIICKIELENDVKEKLINDFTTKNVILKELDQINKKIIEKSIIK